MAYGVSDRLALEFEAEAWASSELQKASDDTSNMPDRLKESGLGDIEAQLRWLWKKETPTRPMLYSFLEVTFPLAEEDDVLLGTQDWETSLGFGVVRGFRWGTLNGRLSIKHDAEEGVEPGEYAIEYLKRTSPRLRWVATLEGEDDEISLIGEAQLTLGQAAVLKLNSGFGLTEKAADVALEAGVIFSF